MLEGRDGSAWCVAGLSGLGRGLEGGGGVVDVIKYRVWERKPTYLLITLESSFYPENRHQP